MNNEWVELKKKYYFSNFPGSITERAVLLLYE